MVDPSGYDWKTWVEGTQSEILYGADLNTNFKLLTDLANKGIDGNNIANNGIDSGALIASGVVNESHIDYGVSDGLGVLQIGKDRTTYGQMIVKGTSLITAANTTNTDITIYYSDGDVCTAGDPAFVGTPIVYAVAYTDNTEVNITYKQVATDSMLVNVDLGGTLTFTENWTIYWMAYGNI